MSSEASGPHYNELTPEEARVILHKGTERPFFGEYTNLKAEGTFICRRCNAPLYRSEDKFESHCGWPSFSAPGGEIDEHVDQSHGMMRTEVRCHNCDAHLGHVFPDGPRAMGGLRYCINGVAIRFVPAAV